LKSKTNSKLIGDALHSTKRTHLRDSIYCAVNYIIRVSVGRVAVSVLWMVCVSVSIDYSCWIYRLCNASISETRVVTRDRITLLANPLHQLYI